MATKSIIMRQFTSVNDVASVADLIQDSLDLKANPYRDKALGENKCIGLIFLN